MVLLGAVVGLVLESIADWRVNEWMMLSVEKIDRLGGAMAD